MTQSNDLLMQPLSDDELAGITGGSSDDDEMLEECLNNCDVTYPNLKRMRLQCRVHCMGAYGLL